MQLGAHLAELRNRFYVALIAIAAGSIGGFFLAPLVLDLLTIPLNELQEGGHLAQLNFNSISGGFDLRMQMGLMIGLIGTSPVWLYEILAFVIPGLHKRERRYLFGFLGAAVPLFLGGAAVGWLVFPRIVVVFLGFVPDDASNLLTAVDYYGFALKFIVSIGAGFVMPVLLVALNFMGILQASNILAGWRWAIIAITIFTALVTPATEPLTMLLLAAPIVALYFMAWGVAWLHDRRVAKKIDSMAGESQTA